MKTKRSNSDKIIPKEQFDRFITLVEERRDLQNNYYDTRNEEALTEIDQARKRIEQMIEIMGLHI